MTKREFLFKVPHVIQVRGWGIAKIEISTDSSNRKEVCYRDTKKQTIACGASGTSWSEVHLKLIRYLTEHGLYD